MNVQTVLLFSAAVVPLVCTPGPDILFISSQSLSGGIRGGLMATLGVCWGYLAHGVLVAMGLAAVVTSSPLLFEAIRWAGIAYLVYLASKLLRSAMTPGEIKPTGAAVRNQLKKGFLTSALNPKGIMMYVAILPQFMDEHGNAALQAAILSATFILWCAAIYSAICFAASAVGSKAGVSSHGRQKLEGGAGVMVLLAAGMMAFA